MNYLLFLCISILIHSLCYLFLRKKTEIRYSTIKMLLIMIIGTAIWTIVEMRIYSDLATQFDFVRFNLLYFVILISALIDYKSKLIPNKILIAALVMRALMYIPECFLLKKEMIYVFMNEGIGVLLAVFLLFFSFLTKRMIGMGDIKLLAIIAIYTGAFFTYSVLFAAALSGAIVGIIMMLLLHKDKSTAIPFGPFLLFGFIVAALLKSY